MTLTELVWKIERFLIKARCYRCYYWNSELEVCGKLPPCKNPSCRNNIHTNKNDNCMYYKKSGWF